ncbi:hypothetical protein TNCV_3248551 [Trichonephila clavipes]|nr:hypothetical protein TNCV_3248551 [Trichonephila clavipes]
MPFANMPTFSGIRIHSLRRQKPLYRMGGIPNNRFLYHLRKSRDRDSLVVKETTRSWHPLSRGILIGQWKGPLRGRVCGGRVACVVVDGSKERSAERGPRGRGTWLRMARQRGLAHTRSPPWLWPWTVPGSTLWVFPRCLTLKNPPAVTLGTLERCGNSGPCRDPDGTGRNP